ncbi:hypothetical protein OIU85_026177 [Salix viminalis]|uniref:SMP domain-containing protein n=1 Tax=Salix viminalis TaxID=40686 RepID=A0A9Q0TN03_SALVM|nr:hypothetical protein OIU85_026177 [Salix viminalis]
MSTDLIFLLLLICFSLHACNARFLGLSDKETKKQVFNKVLVQDVDKLKIHRTTSAPSEMMPSEEQGKQVVGRDDMITRKISLLGATTMNEKDAEALPKQEEGTKGATSGNKVIVSSQADLQQASEIIEGKGRSMLGSAAKDTEEAVRSDQENDIAEDVAVMDYAQPHRKPPIHNEKS